MLALGLILTLSSCSGSQVLKSFLGGGPSVSANVQAGKTNTQSVGQTTVNDNKANKIVQSTGKVSAEKVDNVTVNEWNIWLIVLLVLGWLLPSPGEIGRKIGSLIKGLRGRRDT